MVEEDGIMDMMVEVDRKVEVEVGVKVEVVVDINLEEEVDVGVEMEVNVVPEKVDKLVGVIVVALTNVMLDVPVEMDGRIVVMVDVPAAVENGMTDVMVDVPVKVEVNM